MRLQLHALGLSSGERNRQKSFARKGRETTFRPHLRANCTIRSSKMSMRRQTKTLIRIYERSRRVGLSRHPTHLLAEKSGA